MSRRRNDDQFEMADVKGGGYALPLDNSLLEKPYFDANIIEFVKVDYFIVSRL